MKLSFDWIFDKILLGALGLLLLAIMRHTIRVLIDDKKNGIMDEARHSEWPNNKKKYQICIFQSMKQAFYYLFFGFFFIVMRPGESEGLKHVSFFEASSYNDNTLNAAIVFTIGNFAVSLYSSIQRYDKIWEQEKRRIGERDENGKHIFKKS